MLIKKKSKKKPGKKGRKLMVVRVKVRGVTPYIMNPITEEMLLYM